MKKTLFTLIGFLSVCSLLFGKQIDVQSAENVAKIFLNSSAAQSLNLVYTGKDQTAQRNWQTPNNYYYVFNIGNNNGFVIVSADDVNTPIIGYSTEGNYNADNLPPNFKGWMSDIASATQQAIARRAKSEAGTAHEWENYLAGRSPDTHKGYTSVSQMLTTQWKQGAPYNNRIPHQTNSNSTTPYTGCTATAMAQIMKFHNHPKSGTRATTAYTTASLKFNVPSIDIAKVVYDWANMPNVYSSDSTAAQNNAVAELMYHCGAASKTDYADRGSEAYLFDASLALKNNFDYSLQTYYKRKGATSSAEWKKLLKENISDRLPVLYAGYGSLDGHAFVCNGYDANEYFYFNWGWGGQVDGYFNIDALANVGGFDFSQGHEAVFNIKPNGRAVNQNIVLNSGLVTTATAAAPGMSFDTKVDIKSTGDKAFTGYYAVALTDISSNTKYLLTTALAGSFKTIVANTNQADTYPCIIPANAVPGAYQVKIVYRENITSSWKPISLGTNPHSVNFTVAQPASDLALAGGINTNGIVSGTAGSVFNTRIHVKNAGSKIFLGYYAAALTDTNGNVKYILNTSLAYSLKSILINDIQNINYTCIVPLGVAPDTYQIRVVYRENGASAWKSVNSGVAPHSVNFMVTQAAYGLSLVSGLHTNITSGISGSTFYTRISVKNTGEKAFSGYYTIALTDANGSMKYILNTSLANSLRHVAINGVQNSNYTSVIPNDAAPGNYQVRLVYRENGTSSWKPINTGTNPHSVDFTVHHASPDLILPTGINTGNITSGVAGAKFNTKIYLKNTGNKIFSGYYTAALTDAGGNVKQILNNSLADTYKNIGINTAQNSSYACVVPANTAPGTYQVRVVYKESKTATWKSVNSGATPHSVTFTVQDEDAALNLVLASGMHIGNITSGVAGARFNSKIDIKNIGDDVFSGYYAAALTDTNGNVKYILTSALAGSLRAIGAKANQSNTYGCIIPTNAAAGSYQLRIVYREDEASTWKSINGGASPYHTNFVVTTTRSVVLLDEKNEVVAYPNPVTDVLNIKAGDININKVILTDLSGKVLAREIPHATTTQLSVQNLANGLYILRVETDMGVTIHKVNKQ